MSTGPCVTPAPAMLAIALTTPAPGFEVATALLPGKVQLLQLQATRAALSQISWYWYCYRNGCWCKVCRALLWSML